MKLSVVIPVYNVAPYLRECLSSVSVAAEKLAEVGEGVSTEGLEVGVEVICVDDGSTDGSAAILDEWASSLTPNPYLLTPRILHQENAGAGAARNAGLFHVTGDWLLFLDGDDILHPHALSCIHKEIEGRICDIVFYQTKRFDDGKACEWDPHQVGATAIDCSTVVPLMKSSSWCGGQAYRWKLVSDCRFPMYVHGEDCVYLATALSRAKSILFSSCQLYGYRMRGGSATHRVVNSRLVTDILRSRADVLGVIASAGKHLDKYSAKWIGAELTEGFESMVASLNGEDRENVLSSYRNVLVGIRLEISQFGRFDQMRLKALSVCHWFIARWILSVVPRRLKLVKSWFCQHSAGKRR